MTSVFIGGSRRVSRVNSELAGRLDNVMDGQLRVLIGDANGFDRAAQSYLADAGYRDVTVYCTEGICRNNVGAWPICAVEYHGKGRGREFYTAKDDAMLRDADYGLFAWDGTSKGTLRNVRKMAEQQRPSAVYVAPLGRFVMARSAEDLAKLSFAEESEAAEQLFSGQRRGNSSEGDSCHAA